MNLISHIFIGIAICEAFMLPPTMVLIGATLPDVDYLIGIPHRTITHSLLFVIIAFLITWKLSNKRTAYAFFLGLSSHLILDSITPMGIPLFYPINTYFSFNLIHSNDIIGNIGFILASLIIIINKEHIHNYLFSLKQGQAIKGVTLFILLFFILLTFFPKTSLKIKDIILLKEGSFININGTICSNINIITSKKGNKYQVFDLCDKTGKIKIWGKLKNNLSKGDIINVNGLFTLKYGKPEINYAKVNK